ncbi:MAG: acylphosphatase [Patescibacteria group bacterium]
MKKQIIMTISGRVQGVWFRKTVKDVAEEFGFVGYAKNKSDGCVEVLVCGNEKKFEEFIALMKKGSKLSCVDNVEYEIHDECGVEYSDFKIL